MTKQDMDSPVGRVINEKEVILQELRDRGCRITNQRRLLIDIIVGKECSCCKEIYYQAIKSDPTIGIATVYRLIKTLEEIGAISRKNMYRVSVEDICGCEESCLVRLKDNRVLRLNSREFHEALRKGLEVKGFVENGEIDSIVLQKDA